MRDPELMQIYQRGILDYTALSEIEQGRFHMLLSNFFMKYQLMSQLGSRGLIDSEMHQEQFSGVHELFKLPGVRQWWHAAEHWYAPSFREHLRDQYLEKVD